MQDAVNEWLGEQSIYDNCADCGSSTQQNYTRILAFPEVLVLQIDRFSGKGKHRKSRQRISIPNQFTLTSKAPCHSEARAVEATYRPCGLVFHHGDQLNSGHYTTAVLQPNQQWAVIDDDQCIRSQQLQSLMEADKPAVRLFIPHRLSP
jgi:ubiquitin C-terminal hydrolase